MVPTRTSSVCSRKRRAALAMLDLSSATLKTTTPFTVSGIDWFDGAFTVSVVVRRPR